MSTALNAIKNMEQINQAEYSLSQQLDELYVAANKLGLYDASDYLFSKAYPHKIDKYLLP
jgi:hypothetical protein